MSREDENNMAMPETKLQNKQELELQKKLKVLSKSIGAVSVDIDTDKICREVRGKE